MVPFHGSLLQTGWQQDLVIVVDDKIVGVRRVIALLRLRFAVSEQLLKLRVLHLLEGNLLVGEWIAFWEVFVVEGESVHGEFFLLDVETTQDICYDVEFALDISKFRSKLFDK